MKQFIITFLLVSTSGFGQTIDYNTDDGFIAEAYIPQYGGYCAYAVAESSKKVNIDPETFEIRDGKLYLFYNSWGNNTLKKWNKKNVKGLQKKADLNWEVIKFK